MRSFLLLAAAAVLAGCATQPAIEQPIRIGLLYDSSGAFAASGGAARVGAELAIEMINQRGGVAGRYRVVAVSGDSGSNTAAALAAAEKLVRADKVVAVVGLSSSSYAPPVVDRLESLGALTWVTSAIDNAVFLDKNRQLTFRVLVGTDSFGTVSVRYLQAMAQPRLGKAPRDLRLAVVNESHAFAQAIADANVSEAKKLGFAIVFTGSYGKDTSLTDLFARVKAAQPDIVLHAGYDPVPLWQSMRSQDIRVLAMLGQGMNQTAQSFRDKGLGADLEGFHTTTGIDPAALDLTRLTPAAAATVRQVTAALGPRYPGGIPNFSWSAFNATWVLLDDVLPRAIARHGGLAPQAIAAAARETDIAEGATVLGHGVGFFPPGHVLAGQNERAYTGVSQAIGGEFRLVYPPIVARAQPAMPYPGLSPFARR